MSLTKRAKMEVLRQSIRKVTRLLTESKLPVIMAGMQAKVTYDGVTGKPTAVYLPSLPDNASEKLIDAIQGFVDHEVAHVLFSDFDALKEGQRMKIPRLLNAVEDSFIERKIMAVYEGTKNNVSKMRDMFLDQFIEPHVVKAQADGMTDPKQWWAILGVCAIRAWAGHTEFEIYMSDKWDLLGNIAKLALEKNIRERLQAITCSNESLKVAIRISHIVKEAEKMPEEKPKPEPKEKDEEKPEEKDETPEESDDETESDESEPSDEEGDGEPSDEEEDSDEESDGDGEPSDEEGDGEPSDEEESESGLSSDDSEEESEEEQPMPDPDFEDKDMTGIEDFMEDVISEEAKASVDASSYMPYTRDADKIEPLEDEAVNGRLIEAMEDEIKSAIAPVQRALANAFESKNKNFQMHGKRSGRLSVPSLHLLVTNDGRVYFQNKESRTRDSAVQLVIDISGSMRGQKINLAAQVAWALTEVLDRLKVSCEVICFTQHGASSADPKDKHLYRDMDKDNRSCNKFTRYGPIYMPILKSWDEPNFTQIHKRHFTRVAKSQLQMGGNVDGESLQYAGLRLLERSEPGKVMIVLSDGQPSGDGRDYAFSAHLKEVVRDLTRSGVNVMGIGICDGSVKNYYPKNVVVNKVEDLAGVVMGKVRDALLKS